MTAAVCVAAEHRRIETLQRIIHMRQPGEAAPAGLRARIEALVGLRRLQAQPGWRALAASILVTAAIASGSTFMTTSARQTDGVVER